MHAYQVYKLLACNHTVGGWTIKLPTEVQPEIDSLWKMKISSPLLKELMWRTWLSPAALRCPTLSTTVGQTGPPGGRQWCSPWADPPKRKHIEKHNKFNK